MSSAQRGRAGLGNPVLPKRGPGIRAGTGFGSHRHGPHVEHHCCGCNGLAYLPPAQIAAAGLKGAGEGCCSTWPYGQFTPGYSGQEEEGDYSRSSSGATPQSFFLGAQPL